MTKGRKRMLGAVGAVLGGLGAWFAPRAAALPDDGVAPITSNAPPLDVAAAAIHAETATFALG